MSFRSFLPSVRSSSRSHVLHIVRTYDYENYLATLLLKQPKLRQTAFSLRALNVELALVLDVTSNPMTASARFAFWSDAVENLFSKEPSRMYEGNPVVQALQTSLLTTNNKLSKWHFKRLIETRASARNLSNYPFESVAEIEVYSDGAIGSVYFLLIEALIAERPELQRMHLEMDHIAGHLVKSLGLVNILRGVAHNARRGRCYIPNDLLLKHGASHEDFLRFSSRKEVADVCYDLSCSAKNHLDTTNNLIAKLTDRSVIDLFLPIMFAELYLSRIEEVNFHIFNDELGKKDANLPLKLWWKSWTQKWFGKRVKK